MIDLEMYLLDVQSIAITYPEWLPAICLRCVASKRS